MSLRTLGFVIAAVAICATACGKGETETKRDLTQREKDSILGASTIPGAKAVKRAMTSADSATARQSRLDSAEREP
ncbi:MAG TPA: hypothetical protein VK516_00490 [Gemmatimonadaceae bacterium]|nr:hypothetical protein [Gemmatimonadaceae bacterium]